MSIQDQFLSFAINALLIFKSRPSAIRRALAKRQYARAPLPKNDGVTIAVVQMQADLIDAGVAFAE